MSNPYVGEIRMFSGNFAPQGWLFCQGQLVSIDDYDTLFALIGTTYGGDGQNNFALPNLQSRIPLHQGSGYPLAAMGGQETVTLSGAQLPQHTHRASASSAAGTTTSPSGAVWAASPTPWYSTGTPATAMSGAALIPAGGSQPHDNMSPYLAVNFIISVFGIYPSPS
ncbi:Microcystin-dependent protein [Jatrophihabitans endophyticus]|uniref:Microcystin-dependent protein n=1 Tax=Jatrophihabitans endophyticus TaxID=1206085 RepID=A0A1M5KAA1_9ACTN|nr:tail fiber protein [Jatrophihabitans endophyticus]SHG49419.1 Microcystin-dependent protein [Jatrophihabitans endophyticus]